MLRRSAKQEWQQKAKKRERKRIDFETERVFEKAKVLYAELGRGHRFDDGTVIIPISDNGLFEAITKAALCAVRESCARTAYQNGKAEVVNGIAENICEAILKPTSQRE